jgi:hypothetical protein
MGICVLNYFISSHEHNNVTVLNVPHRHDLLPNLCVNYEAINRKLGKIEKGAYKSVSDNCEL